MDDDERFAKHKDKSKPRIITTTISDHALDASFEEMPSALNYSRTIFPGRKRQDELEMYSQRIV